MTSILRLTALLALAVGTLSSPVVNDVDSVPFHDLSARAVCNSDNLGRCFKPTGTKPTDTVSRASATAFCSSYLSIPVVTSVVATSTPTTSVTITALLTASTETQISISTSDVQATEFSQTTITTTIPFPVKRAASTAAPPKCASSALPSQLSSACACLGVTPSTTYVTATAPVSTITAIQTSSVTFTSTTLATLTETTGTTTIISTAVATQTAALVCSQYDSPYNALGKTYTIDCGYHYNIGRTAQIVHGVASLSECLGLCSGNALCTNPFWVSPTYDMGYRGDCFLTYGVLADSRTSSPGIDSGVLMG